jgi:hypothetical protein
MLNGKKLRNRLMTSNRKTAADNFDPFNDRLSRDIRNTLSEAFVDALARREQTAYREAAEKWRATNPAEIYLIYIQNRLQRYDHIFEKIISQRIDDARLQLLVIWNSELFFEVHDYLERLWNRETGDNRQALKGLIKAAGVYIHMEHKHHQAVKSLSVKSLNLIRQHSHCLTFITNLEVLTEKLKTLDPVPPRLDNPVLREG